MTISYSRLPRHAAVLAALLACAALPVTAQVSLDGCGPLTNGYGPYDYRQATKQGLAIVESYHFAPHVEALLGGMTGPIGGDIAYTLHAYPNHHRALVAMMRLGEREKTPQPQGARYPVECYFERAIRFKREDAVVKMIYATYLVKNKREVEARAQLEAARAVAVDNPFTQYNVGLLYFDLKDYDRALAQAHAAEELGFPRTALKEQLERVGRWKDRAAGPDRPASAAGAAKANGTANTGGATPTDGAASAASGPAVN